MSVAAIQKSCNGKLIESTEVGQKWSEYQIFISEHFTIIIYDVIYILNCSLASYLYTIFQYQACVYWTKDQYDRSHEILSETLKQKGTKIVHQMNASLRLKSFRQA
jgi:hypothetical protein